MSTQRTASPAAASVAGAPAPRAHLALPSTLGRTLSLAQYRGKKVVLYFYEGATCGACQQQLVQLQNDLTTIHGTGAVVIGVSVDPLATSQMLASQLHLGFPLVEDTGHQLGSAFGDFHLVTAGMDMGPVDNHAIFVLDKQGMVRWSKLAADTMVVSDSDVIAALQQA
jgi:peroxiredoxin Q/BCP